jgi:hypothetical protein
MSNTFTTYLNEKNGKKLKGSDFAILHTADEYETCMTGLKTSEMKGYFTEDNGFDPDDKDLAKILKLKIGQSYTELSSIVVVRLN